MEFPEVNRKNSLKKLLICDFKRNYVIKSISRSLRELTHLNLMK